MKKSNKLLLGGFLAGLLLISAIHITLYAKYKAGDFTIYNANDLILPSLQSFPNILFVSVRNVQDATVTFSDAAQVEKSEENNLQYVQKGDTLLITGKNEPNEQNDWRHVDIRLPNNATFSLLNSSLSFETDKKLTANNPVIYLQRSSALFSGTNNPLQLGRVKVFASDSSAIAFRGNTQVEMFDVQLSNSTLEYGKGDFGQLSIVTDSLSRISLQSRHLLKANIKTIAPQ